MEKKQEGAEKRPSQPLPQEKVGKVVERRMKHLLGIINELRPCKLPKTIPEKPFMVGEKNDSLMAINCPFFGSLTEGENEQDIVRNSLRVADAIKCDAIIVSELLYLITQKWGKLRPYLTRVSGIKVDPEKVESDYPESVRKDDRYDPVAKRLERGDPVFVSPARKLAQVFELIRKTFVDEKGKPVYNGPVFVTLGRMEDEVISFFTNEWVRIRFFRSRAYAQKKVLALVAQLKKHGRNEKVEAELLEWKAWLEMWLVMSNISDHSTNQARDMVTGFFVKKIEEAIPNAKVVSVGDTFFKLGSKLVMVTADKNRLNTQGNLAKALKESTESFGKGRSPDKIPDLILGMGPNPFGELRLSTYQASHNPADKGVSMIAQLPMCIDAFRYRSIIRDSNVLKDLPTRVGRKSGFESGVLVFNWFQGLVQPIVDFYGSRVLNNPEVFRSEKGLEAMIRGMKREHLKTYLLLMGDEHYGAGEAMLHRCPGDAERPLKYNWQVIMELLESVCAPIMGLLNNGDVTNGQNWKFATKYEGANMKTPDSLLREYAAIQGDNTLTASQKVAKMKEVSFKREVRSGVHSPDKQVHGYVESLKPYIGFFAEILRRKKKAGVRFDGTLATILYIMGNHIKNTYKECSVLPSDALHIVDLLKKELMAYFWKQAATDVSPEDVERELDAPQDGYVGVARGSIGVGQDPSFAIVLKHKQGDANSSQKRGARRAIEPEEVGKAVLNVSGDDHKGVVRFARDNIIAKSGCHVGGGVCGADWDMPYQNVFSLVVGLPVGGLKSGPVRVVFLDEETMRQFAAKRPKINGKKVFDNALE